MELMDWVTVKSWAKDSPSRFTSRLVIIPGLQENRPRLWYWRHAIRPISVMGTGSPERRDYARNGKSRGQKQQAGASVMSALKNSEMLSLSALASERRGEVMSVGRMGSK